MKSRDRQDPTLLLLLGAGLAATLVWRTLAGLDVAPVVSALRSVARPLGVIVAGGVCLSLVRAAVTRYSLRSRVRFAVVPADEFDPSPETVLRLAAQLGRVRRTVRGWLDTRASAVRVRLQSDPQDRLMYLLEVPAHAAGVLRAALRSYEGIELHEATEQPGHRPNDSRRGAVRAELVLARPSVEPLARLALEPDPLQAFAAALKALRPVEGDRAVVCVELLPAIGSQRRRWRRRLARQARRHHMDGAGVLDGLLAHQSETRALPAELVERRAETRALDAKLNEPGGLFALQILLCCQATDRARAKIVLRSLLSAFEQLADRNWLRPAGLPVPGLAFLGSDLPGRRWWFDRRLRTGLFRPARRGVVTAPEVAAFLKPPTIHCLAENVVRSGALVAPPPDLPTFDTERPRRDLVPLGRVTTEFGERTVGVRLADTFFWYCSGRSRFGKTELAMAQFLHLAKAGHGGLFLDPHEDAVTTLKQHLAAAGLRERVIEINLAGRRATERQPAWNLFELTAADATEAEARVEAVVDAFASALSWTERNTRAINLTTQAAHALAAIARVLPPELAPTIFQLPTLLSDEQWRRAVLPFLPVASQGFWLDRFPRLAEEAITPVTNLIDRLRTSTAITGLLGQSQSSYRIRDAMDHGLIVLACPGSGGTRDRLLANLLVFELLHAAKGRAELPADRRRRFYVFLDEVQTYDGASSGNLAALLEQTAKYGVRAFLLNQNPERLTAATLNAVTTNRSHLLTTALNAHAAQLIAREWADRPHPAAIVRLPRYRFLAQVTHHGEQTRPFLLHGLSVKDLHGDGYPAELPALERQIDQTAGRRPTRDAAAHLQTLDDRIVRHLRRLRGDDAGHGGPPRPPSPPPIAPGGLGAGALEIDTVEEDPP